MDPTALIIEGAKLALQLYFHYLRMAGKTEEEIDTMFNKEREEFYKNNPADLPSIDTKGENNF